MVGRNIDRSRLSTSSPLKELIEAFEQPNTLACVSRCLSILVDNAHAFVGIIDLGRSATVENTRNDKSNATRRTI